MIRRAAQAASKVSHLSHPIRSDQERVRRRREVMLDLFVKVCVCMFSYVQEGTEKKKGKKERDHLHETNHNTDESHRSIVMFEHHHTFKHSLTATNNK